ncbi:MAG TPA: DUF2953 domain-containing protein [Candidatus Latescibacteria bacterium]|nr:DUF2953 domain-containing protein [Candidatus Latescibacterota bacterium]
MELVVGVLALGALTLGLPIVVEVRAEWASPTKLSVWIAPWAGALGVRMALPPKALSLAVWGMPLFSVPLPKKRRPARKGKPLRKPRPSLGESFQRFAPYIRPGFKFLRAAPRYLRLRGGTVYLEFGTGDPAATGRLFGWLCALRPFLGLRLYIRPIFLDRSFSGRASVRLWMLPHRLAWEGTRLGISALRIWWRGRRSKSPSSL